MKYIYKRENSDTKYTLSKESEDTIVSAELCKYYKLHSLWRRQQGRMWKYNRDPKKKRRREKLHWIKLTFSFGSERVYKIIKLHQKIMRIRATVKVCCLKTKKRTKERTIEKDKRK